MNTATKEAIHQVEINNQEYYEMACEFAAAWIKNTMKPFSTEDLKDAMYEAGNPKPREPRVFGAVINKLKRCNLIKWHSYTQYKAREGHGRPSSLWISLEYRKKQQSNAKSCRKAQTELPL